MATILDSTLLVNWYLKQQPKKSALFTSSYLWKMQSLTKFGKVKNIWNVCLFRILLNPVCTAIVSFWVCFGITILTGMCLHWPKHLSWKPSFKLSNVNTLRPELEALLLPFMWKQWGKKGTKMQKKHHVWGPVKCAPLSPCSSQFPHPAHL